MLGTSTSYLPTSHKPFFENEILILNPGINKAVAVQKNSIVQKDLTSAYQIKAELFNQAGNNDSAYYYASIAFAQQAK
jgi:hypothetical protein